jgi:lipopolysaccharide/colanic/teichoic acid biosynthesis glycosyltransferase
MHLVAAREPHFAYHASKRAFDIVIAVPLLILALPVLAVAAAMLAVETRRNPFMIQVRTGYLGREFGMLKLRTMRADEPAPSSDVQAGMVLVAKSADDARITTVGHLMRRTSIDELPQLMSVLAGRMTLIGPRPGLPVEAARYPSSWARRLTVKPGLSGLWQANGRCQIDERRRTAMDRYYISRRSFLFDCRVLVQTIPAVIFMRGAW